jgi:hypothetical protein
MLLYSHILGSAVVCCYVSSAATASLRIVKNACCCTIVTVDWDSSIAGGHFCQRQCIYSAAAGSIGEAGGGAVQL